MRIKISMLESEVVLSHAQMVVFAESVLWHCQGVEDDVDQEMLELM